MEVAIASMHMLVDDVHMITSCKDHRYRRHTWRHIFTSGCLLLTETWCEHYSSTAGYLFCMAADLRSNGQLHALQVAFYLLSNRIYVSECACGQQQAMAVTYVSHLKYEAL